MLLPPHMPSYMRCSRLLFLGKWPDNAMQKQHAIEALKVDAGQHDTNDVPFLCVGIALLP